LHVVAHTMLPVQADAVLSAAASRPEFLPLAQQLAEQCWGLLPGIHRLRFALNDEVPHNSHPTVNRLVSRARAHLSLTLCVGAHVDWPEFEGVLNANPTGPCIPPVDAPALDERTVTIIGSGIAGAGTARALAERGWQVTVLEAGNEPASGASGLPVGVVAPHTSHDDSGVSRLSRAGLRYMEQTMRSLLTEGVDWGCTGVRERRLPGKTRRGGVPQSWLNADANTANDWTRKAPPPAPDDAYWHPRGAWLRPAQLVRALLNHPNIRWQGNAKVDALRCITHKTNDPHASHEPQTTARLPSPSASKWQVLQGGKVLAESTRVVLAAGPGSSALIATATEDGSTPRINPLRGQISWGLMADVPAGSFMPATPVNGNGSFVHNITSPDGPAWYTGATYDRINGDARLLDADHAENLERLQALEPDTAHALAPLFATVGTDAPRVHGWAGVRCGVHDRLPMTGRVPNAPEGLYMNTAMGSRGLTLGLLCGELLAAQWHGEPLPIEARLARFLEATRFKPKA
jgi:tRNA 5-methylaminomethyl-2-thiouridine biosynthesis bifunctional protein